MGEFQNYYQILNLKQSATENEVKIIFRKLAHLYHPDKNSNSIESEIIFRSLHEAYRILSSAELRKQHDLYIKTSTVVKNKESAYKRQTTVSGKKQRAESTVEGICSQFNFSTHYKR